MSLMSNQSPLPRAGKPLDFFCTRMNRDRTRGETQEPRELLYGSFRASAINVEVILNSCQKSSRVVLFFFFENSERQFNRALKLNGTCRRA